MPAEETPEISAEDRWAVARKLQALHVTMSPGEQAVIDALVEVFVTEASGRSIEELLADLPDKTELLDDVAGFMLEEHASVAILPTTVTITPEITKGCTLITKNCPP